MGEKEEKVGTIYIGADHGGFYLKQKLLPWLKKMGEVVDFGALEYRGEDDYNEVAVMLAKAVRKDRDSLGVLICGSGAGMCIQANRISKIRAVVGYSEKIAKLAREHNDANVLCLVGREDNLSENSKMGEDKEEIREEYFEKITKIVKVFLETKYSYEERHARRIYRLDKLEGEI